MEKIVMSNGVKKAFPIILLAILLLLGVADFAFAAKDYPTIITDYPLLPACENNAECRPGQAGFGVPQFIKYIYLFAIGIVGVIGLLAIIFAAFGYVTSAGNPQQASNAKDKIISALLGMILLLGSVVLLRLINPNLLKLQVTESPVTIDVPSGGDGGGGTECRPVSVKWQKSTINVGESVYLIWKLNKNCTESAEIAYCGNNEGSFLRQVRPQGTGCAAGAATGWDPYCQKVISDNILNRAHDTDGSILLKYMYTFDQQCRDKMGVTECSSFPIPYLCPDTSWAGVICNFKKGQPETFYAEGECKMNTGETFFTGGKVIITVEDGK